MIKVWDALIRTLHWTLVAAISLSWSSTLDIGVPERWHESFGYTAAAVIAIRLIWGFVGSAHARWRSFLHKPQVVLQYSRLVWKHKEPRYIGHNPLGGWMVLALMSNIGAVVVTGWLQTTDRYWGSETLETIHRGLAWGLVGLIALHVLGVMFTSVRHRESLVRAMITGRKAPPQGTDVA